MEFLTFAERQLQILDLLDVPDHPGQRDIQFL